ncbi:hypothetical protein JRO89_XS12G0151400 [Xanthoceras sorbifolium]|uniref:Cation efflux protein transmembrane domain-containing protein n=1 Tax=Xanthoceras sorbifolium TaxID=99658 RepID=A0ABQ8HCP7_9ROSI|nr:hypothetical protein JRO89_XS12G0151400 [Xanthoceras sorbifolium]
MEKNRSFNYRTQEIDSWNTDLGLSTSDRRMAFSRQASFHQDPPQTPISLFSSKPFLSRTTSSIDIPPDKYLGEADKFSIFRAVRKKSDLVYTYGYKRLEVLSAFTNALFLLFMTFSLAVEALHAFIQDESEHKHYLIVSAVTNLLVNLIGVWFFRNYARVSLGKSSAAFLND